MASLGYVLLVLALCVSIYAAAAYFLEARGRRFPSIVRARNALITATGLISASVLVLLYAILTHDFRFEYVASYTSLHTSPIFLLAALWTGNTASLLFWTWILSVISLVVILRKQGKYAALLPYAAAVMMATQVFFLILLAAGNHPFGSSAVVPADGFGLNPMLENVGMVLHPPALYAGYVGFTVPFAFAISALLNRRLNNEWLQASRRWMLFAWLALGVGNLIGAWWAYVELGWGGYWAWDPVENAGLMPWLLATALLHSSVMQRRKSTFKIWNMILIILVFSMVIFGTFLTRSNILSSLHTFGESGLEPYFITFLTVVLIGGFALVYYRSDDLKSAAGDEAIISRDASFILNNIIFVGVTALILIGTMKGFGTSSFNLVGSTLFMVTILLAGVCTLIGWRQLTLRQLFNELLWPLAGAVVLGIILGVTVVRQPLALLSFVICSFVLLSILLTWSKETRGQNKSAGTNLASTAWNLARSNTQRYGGYVVHIGIILIAVGVIGSSFFGTQKEASLKQGDSLTINQYTVTYNGVNIQDAVDKTTYSADVIVTSGSKPFTSLVAQEYFQKAQQQSVTNVALHSNLLEDLYVTYIPPKTVIGADQTAVQDWQNNGATADFKVLVNPLVIWIWIGGGVFLLGGLVAFWPARKSRFKSSVTAEPVRVTQAIPSPPARAAEDEIEKQVLKLRQSPGKPGPLSAHSKEAEDEIENQILGLRQSSAKYCSQCGYKNKNSARFCTRCGTRLTREKKNE
jgi:cytochrome c-type biogenesis protein CcmF